MKQIASALVKAQKAFGPALKTNSNPHFKSKYADLSACVEAVIDSLNEAGIFLSQPTHMDDTGVTVETVFIHESGETYSSGKLHVPATKQDAQGYGSALTYARRYSLMAACGIAPEDDDGNAASKPKAANPANLPASIKHSPNGGPVDVQEDRKTTIQLAASVGVELFKAGEKDAAFDKIADHLKDSEESLYLWEVLKSHSTYRAYIKFRQDQAAKRNQQQQQEEQTA